MEEKKNLTSENENAVMWLREIQRENRPPAAIIIGVGNFHSDTIYAAVILVIAKAIFTMDFSFSLSLAHSHIRLVLICRFKRIFLVIYSPLFFPLNNNYNQLGCLLDFVFRFVFICETIRMICSSIAFYHW